MSQIQEVVADPAADVSLDILRLAGRIGALIRGINLSERLPAPTVTAIRAALVRHKVIFFRGQSLDDVTHLAFAEQLGTPLAHPTLPVAAGSQYMVELNSRKTQPPVPWHTDMAFLPDYPEISILRSVVIPEFGGDTMWANTAAAYVDLQAPLKALVEGLRAVHAKSFEHLAAAQSTDGSPESAERRRLISAAALYEAEHPVVTVHPESGERCLLLGHFVKNLVGFGPQESQRLLAILQDHITRPENTVRWKWTVGDVAIWDNRATQHKPISDYDAQHRHVRRVTLAGPMAVGIDGKPSRLLRPTQGSTT